MDVKLKKYNVNYNYFIKNTGSPIDFLSTN